MSWYNDLMKSRESLNHQFIESLYVATLFFCHDMLFHSGAVSCYSGEIQLYDTVANPVIVNYMN